MAGSLGDGVGLPSAEIDSSGKIYVAWQDCRFRSGCPANDIVYSTSTNGTSWSAVTRVPIDATTSGVDHFIPGIGVDPATSGTTAKIGLYYYFYPSANCTASTCQLEVGYLSSANGGSTWSTPTTIAGPMSLTQIANTTQGRMVGDYLSTSVIGGKAVSVFSVGKNPTNGQAFDEALHTAGPLTVTGGSVASSTRGATSVVTHTGRLDRCPCPSGTDLAPVRCVPAPGGTHLRARRGHTPRHAPLGAAIAEPSSVRSAQIWRSRQ